MTNQDPRPLTAKDLPEDRYTQLGVHPPAAEIDAHEFEAVDERDARMQRFVGANTFVDADGQPVDPASMPMVDIDDPAYADDDWED
jgi:hypothetical protein